MATTILMRAVVGTPEQLAVRGWIMLSPGYEKPVPDAHVEIAKGMVDKVTEVNAAQYDIIRALYTQGRDTNDVAVSFDGKAVADIVIAALNEKGIKVDTGSLGDELAATLDAALKDDFAAVNKNIDTQEFVVSPKA